MRSIRLRAKHSSSGFSLLEIIAALFILSVGILAIAQLFSNTMRSVERADRHSRAAAYARSLLEEALAMDDVEQAEGTFDLGNGYEATRTVTHLSTEELEVTGREVSLYDIRVAVTWPPQGILDISAKKTVYEKPE